MPVLRALAAIVAVAVALVLALMSPPPQDGGGPRSGLPTITPGYPEGTPGARLSEYVASDFAGERLEAASWMKFKDWVVWGGEPTWDSAYVQRGQRIAMGQQNQLDAKGEVTYDTLGELDLTNWQYKSSPSRQTVPFTLVQKQGGWRIAVPMLRPHPGAEAAIAYLERMKGAFKSYAPTIDASIKQIRADLAATPLP